MVAREVQGIDLFKIANRSISGWIPSLKTGTTVRQPFCSQLEERLLLWLEYHPLVVNYARGDIDPQFATKYRLPIPKHAPFAIGYTFEDKPHHYLPDAVGTLINGQPFIAEAGMEDDKRGDRNLAKAEAAGRLARLQQGTFWIGTERTLTKRRHYNLVYLHARRKTFPAFADIATALQEVWPWGEMAEVAEVAARLSHQFPVDPAFQECIRRLYLLPTGLSMTAIREHTEMQHVATRLTKETGKPDKLPSYAQVRKEVHQLKSEPELVAVRKGAKSVPRERQSAESFVLSIPAPALLTQVDEHTMDLYVVTPDGTTVASRVHAAVLICVKTAAILGAVLALGPLKEEDYRRLVKQSLERKDHLVGITGCEHSWPCFGKPAIIFHDRGKIFTSQRPRQVLVDRLGMITEQAPPYAPSAKGTVESLFRWMTERFEKRLPNTSYGVHDAETAAQAGGMTLEELERCFYQAIVDDYQQAFDGLRRQRPCVLWEQAAAQYLGSPDDLKLLLMKAVNRKTPHHGYRVQRRVHF